MNMTNLRTLVCCLALGVVASAAGQTGEVAQAQAATNAPVAVAPLLTDAATNPVAPVALSPTEGATNAPDALATSPAATNAIPKAAEVAPLATEATGGLRLNFRGAPLEMVLDYLSKAAGYTIVLETEVKGTIDVWNNQPLSKEEAIAVLNSALNRNGYAVVRTGRTLTIVPRDDAKKRNIKVQSGANPQDIPLGDEMITHIIPVRYANVTQMVKDLQPLLPSFATLTANESASALVLTDTQTDVHRMVEIVKALDTSINSALTIRVFQLKNADAAEMVQVLTRLFPDETGRSRTDNTPPWFRFSRRGGEGGPFGGGGGGGGAGSSEQMKGGKVIAVADQRTSSVIVTAASELMPQIAEMITQLDSSQAKKQKVYVIQLENAEINDVMPVLRDMFNKDTTTQRSTASSQNNQNSALTTRRSRTTQNTTTGTGTRGGGGMGSAPQGF